MEKWDLDVGAIVLDDKDRGPCREAGPFSRRLLVPGNPFLTLKKWLCSPEEPKRGVVGRGPNLVQGVSGQ